MILTIDHCTSPEGKPLYTLCRDIPEREWECFEIELEDNEFLLRDHIIDLLSKETWPDD